MHEVKSGMAKEFSSMKEDFRLFSQMEKLGKIPVLENLAHKFKNDH